jgi:quercetin dioxygenase-like cupin family protein
MPIRRFVLLVLLAACARREPRVLVGPLDDGLAPFLAAHRPAPEQNVRIDLVTRTEGASYHLVQVRDGEAPHRHRAHDLTVVVLRGRGTLRLGARSIPLAAGDAVLVPRSVVHWFTNGGRERSVTLAIFTPPLDAPDSEPAPEFD